MFSFSANLWGLCNLRSTTAYCCYSGSACAVWRDSGRCTWCGRRIPCVKARWRGGFRLACQVEVKWLSASQALQMYTETSAQLKVWLGGFSSCAFRQCCVRGSLERAEILQCCLLCSRTLYFLNFRDWVFLTVHVGKSSEPPTAPYNDCCEVTPSP